MLIIDPEFQSLIPPLSADEIKQLEENILAEGCRDPLVTWVVDGDQVLIDGHNRYDICSRHGLSYETVEVKFDSRDDAKLWIVRNQLGRRNISDFVKAELALVAKPIIEARARANQQGGQGGTLLRQNSDEAKPVRTDESVAELANVSRDTVRKVEMIKETAAPELLNAVRSGAVSINTAADIATLPQDKQADVVSQGKGAALETAKQIRAKKAEERREKRLERVRAISAGNAELSTAQRYPVIYADPPWRYDYAETESRAIENQYPTMDLEAICALPVQQIATDDAVLFLWGTSPKLVEALRVIESWGFTYRTCAVWHKPQLGMGYYFRQQHELLLVATRGSLPAPAPADRIGSVITADRAAHSAKPAEFAEAIERMYPTLPKIELFCRSPREGWAVWGNQSAA